MDGNEEHKDYFHDIGASYRDLAKDIEAIPNVVYMQDNVIIIRGVAFLGTNGWWTYDFDPSIDKESSIQSIQDHFGVTYEQATSLSTVGLNDAAYMINSVRKLQTHKEVGAIVIISHTVPAPWIISHDLDLVDTWRFNGMGNSQISRLIDQDSEQKIKTWCFGHYHKTVDQEFGGIQYLSNPRGRGNTPWRQVAYYPKRIVVEF